MADDQYRSVEQPAGWRRLILNDYNLVRHDERVRVQARRQAEIDKFEEGKSDEVKF